MARLIVSCCAALTVLLAAAPAEAALDFRRCSQSGFQCAKLVVPVDYDKPQGRTTTLDVGRLPARDRARRIGSLLINYGGPGGDAVSTTKRIGGELFARLNQRFDLVALDPRGTGSRPFGIDCKTNQERSGVYGLPYTHGTGTAARRKLARARSYAQRCEQRNRVIGPHVSTANLARDMNELRRELGERKVSYFGFSYGTFVGATFVSLFPERVRAAVLDGALDPDAYVNDPAVNLGEQTASFEDSLNRYFIACSRKPDVCKWTRGRSPRRAYDALVARAQARPIPAPNDKITQGHSRPVSGDEMNFAVAGELYAKQAWPELTKALNQARRGDASIMRLLTDQSFGREPDGGYDPGLDRYFAIGAAEQAYGDDPRPFLANYVANRRLFPHFFWNNQDAELPYTQYDLRDADAFRGPFRLPRSAAPALVIGNTHDAATPISGARALTRQLGNARLLVMRGDGHTAYGGNTPCIDTAVNRYLLAGRLPARGKTCQQRVPFPLPEEATASAASAAASVPRSAPDTPLSAPF